ASCSADFQSAVSPNCIRQSVGSLPRAGVSQRLAECNSTIQAIQQSTTLRCDEALNRYSHTAAIQRTRFAVRCFVIAALLAVALLAGCAVGPDYHRPAALSANPMPAAFGDAAITNAGNWK